jgi:hypothetical protein
VLYFDGRHVLAALDGEGMLHGLAACLVEHRAFVLWVESVAVADAAGA